MWAQCQRISRFLAAHTSAFILAVAVLSWCVPGVFAWVRGNAQSMVLGAIMLAMGMTLSAEDWRVLARRPWDILLGVCAQYGIMPLLALLLVWGLGLPRGMAVGLLLVGCCPGGVSSNIMSLLGRGDVAFSVGMTSATTLLAPLATPLLMLWLAGERVEVPAGALFQSILWVTVAPIAVGTLLNHFFGRRPEYGQLCSILPGVAVLALACIVGGVVSAQGDRFFTQGALIFAGVFLHNALGYALGYLTATALRMPPPKRRTLSLEVGMQNAGLATVLATQHFQAHPAAAVAAAISCAWHSLSGTLLATIFRRTAAQATPEKSSPDGALQKVRSTNDE